MRTPGAPLRVAAAAPALLAVCCSALLSAQARTPLTEAGVRALTRQAVSAARGDRDAVVLGFDERARERWGDFESFPLSLVRREDLTIVLTAPLMAYRRALAEHLRMREPLARVPWTNDVVISVSVERLDAPDVSSIRVTRDGRTVEPRRSALRPMTFTNGNGETAKLHAGEVYYPTEAFGPGATVVITATPAVGERFETTLTAERLEVLR